MSTLTESKNKTEQGYTAYMNNTKRFTDTSLKSASIFIWAQITNSTKISWGGERL